MNDNQHTSARLEFLGLSVIIIPELGSLHMEYTSMVRCLIVALIGLKAGILSKELFAAAAIMCLATTFVVPLLLKWLVGLYPQEMES